MCFGSKSDARAEAVDSSPPARQTVIKNPDLFRTPTFERSKAPRRESTASGHSPSHSLHEGDAMRSMSTVSPGQAPSEKRRRSSSSKADEGRLRAGRAGEGAAEARVKTGTVTAGYGGTAPEIHGLDFAEKENGVVVR